MAWVTPFTAVTGDTITSAGWNGSGRDNLLHLRAITGGDPGAADLALISSGATAGQWIKVPDGVLADQKISQTVRTTDGFNDLADVPNTGFWHSLPDPAGAPHTDDDRYFLMQIADPSGGGDFRWQIAAASWFPEKIYTRMINLGDPLPWFKIPICSGVVQPNLNADLLDGLSRANYARSVTVGRSGSGGGWSAQTTPQIVPNSDVVIDITGRYLIWLFVTFRQNTGQNDWFFWLTAGGSQKTNKLTATLDARDHGGGDRSLTFSGTVIGESTLTASVNPIIVGHGSGGSLDGQITDFIWRALLLEEA